MKLGQIEWHKGIVAAIWESEGMARPIPDYNLYDVVRIADLEREPLASVAQRLADRRSEPATPLIPIFPKEVWACGCTYRTSAEFRDAEHGTREGFYAYVHTHPRPEIFFKGTARFCVGPGQPIGIREDSAFTAPEPELAVLLGSRGRLLGYTLANDVSAWDIERENPLYLPQSKLFAGCVSLGPVIVTEDEIPDPYALEMTCTIERNGEVIFSGSTSTANLARKIEELVAYLLRANPVPAGSVLLTGTGIIVREDCALAPGDVVRIRVPEIGELVNPTAPVS